MRKLVKSSLLLFVASYFLSSAFALQPGLGVHRPRDHDLRAILAPDPPASSATSAAQTTAEHTTAAASTSAAPTSTQQPTSTQPSSTTQAPTSTAPTTTGPPATSNPASKTVVGTTATNSDGQIVTSVITVSSAPSTSSTPSAPPSDSNSDSGIGTGTIIGLSVAGGVAVIAIISFFIWKFTRKRFSDFDDNEAIKWPELNTHGNDVHALPTNSTGRSGFGAENESDLNLTRAPSPGAYAQSVGASSIGTGHDPYAVPPLPHLNPSQPYRDDAGAYGQSEYYDPYRGPVPNSFGDGIPDHGGEAIPMTQMAARTRSPGPQLAYDMQGRASPGPQAGYGYGGVEDRTRSPNPAAMSGTRSPGPHVPYGYGQ